MVSLIKGLKIFGKVVICIATYPILIVGGFIYVIIFGFGHLLGECVGILEPIDPKTDTNPFHYIFPLYSKILCEDD